MDRIKAGGGVVPFRRRCQGMKDATGTGLAAVAAVRAYWEALRQGRQVPMRAEIDPRGIECALEYAFILERIAPQVARFRLAGMHLNDLMGMEVRGMPLSAFFAPAARPAVAETVERVFAGPEIAEMTLGAESGFGKPVLKATMLILPLRSDLGDISRALGCLVTQGPLGRAPRRFDHAAMRLTALDAGRPTGAGGPVLPAPARGFAEPGAGFAGAGSDSAGFAGSTPAAPPRSRAHLRLVRSGD